MLFRIRNRIRQFIKQRNPLELFLIKGAVLFLLYYIGKTVLNKSALFKIPYHNFKLFMTKALLYPTKTLLGWMGYESDIQGKLLIIMDDYAIRIDRACLSMNLMALFAGFLIIYPGKLRSKLWYIPMGIIIIYLLNILRVSGLGIINVCCPASMDFYHRYLFKIIIYCLIFLMWFIWIRRYGYKGNKGIRV